MATRTIGPFQLEKQIGAGGMGNVYLATFTKTGQKVALKVLAPDNTGNAGIAKRFEREIDILKRLRHPHIVRYLAAGTYKSQRFFAMELMPRGSLEKLLKEKGRLSWEQTIEYGIQICQALEHAHNNGVIHRDLKPANLFLTKDGTLKLGDFGIARDNDATQLTAKGRTVGTYAYMAPEQISGSAPISAKTDLYALGCVLYEMLTGHPPFQAATPAEMLYKHLQNEPERIASAAIDCPIWLEDVVMQLLKKHPDQRPYDALFVQMKLEEVGKKVAEQSSMATHVAAGGQTALSVEADQTELKKLLRKKKRRKKRKREAFYERSSFLIGCLVCWPPASPGPSGLPAKSNSSARHSA